MIRKCYLPGIVILMMTSFNAQAQSTPTEFAELSLEALLDVDITKASENEHSLKRWSAALQYRVAEFDGYLDGDSKISRQEVLFSPDTEIRTNRNFPIVPTEIVQYATILQIGYKVSANWQVTGLIPLIRQETDHISSIENFSQFLIRSQGIGDTVVSSSYRFNNTQLHHWWVSGGVSFPTGSIDEVGDTPRAAGNQQLPFTMQLGSGTFDFPFELGYQYTGNHNISINLSAIIRTGRNDRNYRLGNNYAVRAKYKLDVSNSMVFFTGAEFGYSDSITGQDDEITVTGDFPFPVSISNPDFFGGQKLSLNAGFTWVRADSFRATADFNKPIYQNLNGIQIQEVWRSGLQLTFNF